MTHYICTGGCRGISYKLSICKDSSCLNHGQRLEQCDCFDGEHGGAFETPPDEDEDED